MRSRSLFIETFFAKVSKGRRRKPSRRVIRNHDGPLFRVTADGEPNNQIVKTNESEANGSLAGWAEPLKPIRDVKNKNGHHDLLIELR